MQEHNYTFIESFAGSAVATNSVKSAFPGKQAVPLDILYSSSFDLNKSSGMALLG